MAKELVIIAGAIKTPPMSRAARRETGFLIRLLQDGQLLGLPSSRPMPSIGPRCHELRIQDEAVTWRIVYRIDPTEIVILEVFQKDSQKTPKTVIDICKRRLRRWDVDTE
jgi:phage-related protein